MAKLGMVIDLKRCVGCHGCVTSCKAENGTPPKVFWSRVLEREEGKYPTARRLFLPVLCNHCSEPACETACPTHATYRTEEGIVRIDENKCIGCRACVAACPYGARFYIKEERRYYTQEQTPFEKLLYNVPDFRPPAARTQMINPIIITPAYLDEGTKRYQEKWYDKVVGR